MPSWIAVKQFARNRYFLREWLVLATISLTLVVTLLASGMTSRADNLLFDRLLHSQAREPHPDIIIVAIDNLSLSEIGRWPWSREVHARLLETLAEAKPRAVGLDIIITEPERDSDADMKLGRAMSKVPVFVPMVWEGLIRPNEGPRVLMPVSPVAEAAAAIVHINMYMDADGRVRSIFLREGDGERWWPHFAWAMFTDADRVASNLDMPGVRAYRNPKPSPELDASGWKRDNHVFIPYSGPPGNYPTIPYASVLNGEVPASMFAGKFVLVGATGTGMLDAYSTPLSDSSTMPGIEIHANILDALLTDKLIRVAPGWVAVIWSLIPVILLLLGFTTLSPRVSLGLTLALIGGVLITNALALRLFGIWMPPVSALATLLVAYPLWSWRRLEAAISYLGGEMRRLDSEPNILPEPVVSEAQGGDVLQRRIDSMQRAVTRIRDLRRFVFDIIDHLPDATLVMDRTGRILLSNRLADDLFIPSATPVLRGVLMTDLLQQLTAVKAAGGNNDVPANWIELMLSDTSEGHEFRDMGIEVKDATGRDLLVKTAPAVDARVQLVGWIASLIDLSAVREAERQRDEMLRFLSHDMRSPQSSILALLELQKRPETAIPVEKLHEEIGRHAQRTLTLNDDFVQVTRAESHEYRFEDTMLADLLMDATDELWTLAKSKSIELRQEIADEDYYVSADRGLMTRAILNLISNAIKYSPPNTVVTCSMEPEYASDGQRWIRLHVKDQGYGISEEDQSRLFRRFARFSTDTQPRIDGLGLGLAFVKIVIDRHRGVIGCASAIGAGSTFTIRLPAVE